nr:MAG TPA: hypothetical protein [Caudoviricetes sp.]
MKIILCELLFSTGGTPHIRNCIFTAKFIRFMQEVVIHFHFYLTQTCKYFH